VGPSIALTLVWGDNARMEREKIVISYVVAFQTCKFEHDRIKKNVE
jgi:hypothetical protein